MSHETIKYQLYIGVVIIRKLKSRAYVLLESLVALALVTICDLILTAIDTGRRQLVNSLYQQEVYVPKQRWQFRQGNPI